MRRGLIASVVTACLLLGGSTLMAETRIEPARKGVILFAGYPVRDMDILAGLDDPNVVGLEAVFEWKDLEPAEGIYQWGELDRALSLWHSRGKFIDLRVMTANSNTNVTPEWVFRRHGVRRIAEASFSDFAAGMDDWKADAGTVERRNGELFLSAGAAVFHTGPPLGRGAVYTVQMDRRSSESGCRLLVEAFSPTGGGAAHRRVAVPDGVGLRAVELPLGPHEDYQLRIVAERGTALIDNLLVHRTSWISSDEQALLDLWIPGPSTSVQPTSDPLYARFTSSAAGPGEQLIARIDHERHPITPGRRTYVEFRYKTPKAGTFRVRQATLLPTGEPDGNMGNQWRTQDGEEGWKGFWVTQPVQPGLALEFSHLGPGSIEISEIRCSHKGGRVVEFPDFFQPEFRAALRRFTAAVAARYDGHPALHAVAVMGNGRWEELMLDGDRPGVLDAQWFSAGYTPARHVAMVESSVQDILTAFPHTKTQLQTAYGLKQVTDPGIAYRRMGGMAALKGAMLKQNGMTERYDTWHEPGEPSWLFARYRHHPGVDLVHESAGQIYYNYWDVSGHPISYINRALSNGTDYYYLYEADLNTRSVARYFDYAATMAGSGLFTSNHAVAAKMTLRQDLREDAPLFRNIWCGLRPVWVPPAPDAMWQERSDETVMVPWNDEKALYFDLDDRSRYDGLFGASIWSRIHMEPGAEAVIERYSEATHEWSLVDTIRGASTAGFVTSESYLGDVLTLSRNGGIDPYRDIRVRSISGGLPGIQAISVEAVHARGWARRPLTPTTHSGQAIRIDHRLSHRVAVPAGSLPTSIAIPLWASNGAAAERVYAAVHAVDANGDLVEIATREFEYPNDGDLLEVELSQAVTAPALEVTLRYDRGPLGWYRGNDGHPAIYLYSRIDGRTEIPVSHAAKKSDGAWLIDTLLPAEGFVLGSGTPSLQIERWLSGEWHAVPATSVTGGEPCVLFQPQPPGRFRVSGATMEPRPILLSRREALLPSLERAPGLVVIRTLSSPRESGALCPVDGSTIEWTLDQPLETAPGQHLEFRLHNESASGLARIWWADMDEAYSAERSCWIPLVPHDDRTRLYSDAIGVDVGWKGRIARMKLDLCAAGPPNGRMTISDAAVTAPNRAAFIDFADAKHLLTPLNNVGLLRQDSDGQTIGTVVGAARLDLPRSAVTVDAAADQVIRIRLRNDSQATEIGIRWGNLLNTVGGSHSLRIAAGPGRDVDLTIPTAELDGWKGTITRLGFDIPTLQSGESLTLRDLAIESIQGAE